MEISNPYINTILSDKIGLRPDQINNDLYINLKQNLISKLEGKCYLDIGFISKIYKIINHDAGLISGENLHGVVSFKVDFSLKLCRPLRGTNIICKVFRVTKSIITLTNGPILVINSTKRYNKDVFFTDNNNVLRYKTSEKRSKILGQGEYVVVNIESITFDNKEKRIMAIGFLNKMATDKQVQKFHDDINDESSEIVDIKNYED